MAEQEDLSGRVSVLDDERASLAAQLAVLSGRAEQSEAEAARLAEELAEAYKTIDADREKVETLIAEIAILESLRDEVTAKLLARPKSRRLEQQRAQSCAEQMRDQVGGGRTRKRPTRQSYPKRRSARSTS